MQGELFTILPSEGKRPEVGTSHAAGTQRSKANPKEKVFHLGCLTQPHFIGATTINSRALVYCTLAELRRFTFPNSIFYLVGSSLFLWRSSMLNKSTRKLPHTTQTRGYRAKPRISLPLLLRVGTTQSLATNELLRPRTHMPLLTSSTIQASLLLQQLKQRQP